MFFWVCEFFFTCGTLSTYTSIIKTGITSVEQPTCKGVKAKLFYVLLSYMADIGHIRI